MRFSRERIASERVGRVSEGADGSVFPFGMPSPCVMTSPRCGTSGRGAPCALPFEGRTGAGRVMEEALERVLGSEGPHRRGKCAAEPFTDRAGVSRRERAWRIPRFALRAMKTGAGQPHAAYGPPLPFSGHGWQNQATMREKCVCRPMGEASIQTASERSTEEFRPCTKIDTLFRDVPEAFPPFRLEHAARAFPGVVFVLSSYCFCSSGRCWSGRGLRRRLPARTMEGCEWTGPFWLSRRC